MKRAAIVGLVVMGLALAGCGAATLAVPGPVAVEAAPGENLRTTVTPPQNRLSPGLRPGVVVAEPVAPPDGELPVGYVAFDPSLRLGPAMPDPFAVQIPTTTVPAPVPEATAPAPEPPPPPPVNIYAHTMNPGAMSAAVADVPTRVYVPNSDAATVSVIDPATMKVVDRFAVGTRPHHVTPSWDLTKLYVNNTEGNTLTELDPHTGRPTRNIRITDPYNLYFTPGGDKAIVVAERFQRLDFYNAEDWTFIKSVGIPWAGVDHADFTADGRYFIASCEFSGQVVKVDTEAMEVVGRVNVGSMPIDVKLSPDGTVLYVANQGRHGVSLVDPETMTEIGFIRTGTGAHGLNVSRDTATLFVSNRLEGTISVIDFATQAVRTTWRVGGSPDMLQVSPDGAQLWASNRFHGSVSVIDTTTGKVIATIPTGAGAHGVSFFPQPGRYNVGHNGVYR